MATYVNLLWMAALAGGAAIPVGAWLARFDGLLPGRLRNAANHWVMAFGAGALLSAVALVLVPEGGVGRLPGLVALVPVILGALAALGGADLILSRHGGSKAQFMAMLMDFIPPECIALGAVLTAQPQLALLLAVLIGAQNLPEASTPTARWPKAQTPPPAAPVAWCCSARLCRLARWPPSWASASWAMRPPCWAH